MSRKDHRGNILNWDKVWVLSGGLEKTRGFYYLNPWPSSYKKQCYTLSHHFTHAVGCVSYTFRSKYLDHITHYVTSECRILRLERVLNFLPVMMMDWRCWSRCRCSHGYISDIARWNQPTISPLPTYQGDSVALIAVDVCNTEAGAWSDGLSGKWRQNYVQRMLRHDEVAISLFILIITI
jgi:hypothetical protein